PPITTVPVTVWASTAMSPSARGPAEAAGSPSHHWAATAAESTTVMAGSAAGPSPAGSHHARSPNVSSPSHDAPLRDSVAHPPGRLPQRGSRDTSPETVGTPSDPLMPRPTRWHPL